VDIHRVSTVRKQLGDTFPLMVDANQQWDRPSAQRMCRTFEQFNLIWIEEPLDCYDAEGHAALAAQFDTPIATGEMLTSVSEHWEFIRQRGADYLMPDAARARVDVERAGVGVDGAGSGVWAAGIGAFTHVRAGRVSRLTHQPVSS
ncbi:enolase C-terminal domain-like protein, partial [Burkholderia anthina]|uniref:enolase C-terminal domain-like protein n=1 Tax=Burkholderia anthina TaxID=179879 RepID=UPI002445ED4A